MEFRRQFVRRNRRDLRANAAEDAILLDISDTESELSFFSETVSEISEVEVEVSEQTRAPFKKKHLLSLRNIVPALRFSKQYHLECGICADDSKRVLLNHQCRPAIISEIKVIPENTIFLNPCGRHPICKECLVRTVTSAENPPINREFSLVPCLSTPLGGCETAAGMKVFFDSNHIRKVLDPQQFQRYIELEHRFRFPGYEIIRCPSCNVENIFPVSTLENTTRGKRIITCAQNNRCFQRFCYDCSRRISRTATACSFCSEFSANNEPFTYNHNFFRPRRDRNDKSSNAIFFRNNELTAEIVIEQLAEVATAARTFVRCFVCLIPILKTEQCNGLSHCATEVCYACGASAKQGYVLSEHWSADGFNGCPRWDRDPYWNKTANCEFKCLEGKCYGDQNDGICELAEHQTGIQNMDQERKCVMIYRKLLSLPSELREHVVEICRKDDRISDFLPAEKTFDFISENHTIAIHNAFSERIIFDDDFKDYLKREKSGELRLATVPQQPAPHIDNLLQFPPLAEDQDPPLPEPLRPATFFQRRNAVVYISSSEDEDEDEIIETVNDDNNAIGLPFWFTRRIRQQIRRRFNGHITFADEEDTLWPEDEEEYVAPYSFEYVPENYTDSVD